MVKKRWREILNYLDDSKVVTSDFLAQKLNVSSRTIRNDLKELEDVLKQEGAQLVSKTNSGYSIRIEDAKKYQSFLFSLHQDVGHIPNTSQEKVHFLLETFLANNDKYVKMDDLCEQLYVSRSSLTNDLKKVRIMLGKYNLDLITRPGYGLKVDGNEFDLRLCIASSTIGKIMQSDKEEKVTLKKIASCIQSVLHKTDLRISDISYQNLIVHIYIAIKRIEDGNYVPMDTMQLNEIEKEIEYKYAKELVQLLEKEFHIHFPKNEVGYIAIHLASKRIVEKNHSQENVVVSPEIYNLVTQMLDVVEKNFHYHFHEDLELRMVLAMHLIPFSVRMKYDMNIKNPLLKEIKTRYTLAYMMAISACDVLEKHYQKQIKEEEIGYIALHFNLALERRKTQGSKKNIVIVCSTGRGSAQLLAWKVREEFDRYLGKVDTCDVTEMKDYDCNQIDYVITTVPIPYHLNKPVLHVQLFLEDSDMKAIKSFLSEKQGISSFKRYFNENLFFTDLEGNTKEEILWEMVEKIQKEKDVPNNFFDAVMEREKLSFTAFGNKVAIPHPIKPMGNELFACVAILKKPILWNDQKVQFILMISLANDQKQKDDMQHFTKILSKLLFNNEYINELIHKPLFSKLMEIIGNIEEEIGD